MATADVDTIWWDKESTYIDVNQEEELEFWSWRFRVSRGKLKQAVRAVGPKFEDIERHLNGKRY